MTELWFSNTTKQTWWLQVDPWAGTCELKPGGSVTILSESQRADFVDQGETKILTLLDYNNDYVRRECEEPVQYSDYLSD